jgi:hypothetical protein
MLPFVACLDDFSSGSRAGPSRGSREEHVWDGELIRLGGFSVMILVVVCGEEVVERFNSRVPEEPVTCCGGHTLEGGATYRALVPGWVWGCC